jgi:hypothetical protein
MDDPRHCFSKTLNRFKAVSCCSEDELFRDRALTDPRRSDALARMRYFWKGGLSRMHPRIGIGLSMDESISDKLYVHPFKAIHHLSKDAAVFLVRSLIISGILTSEPARMR